MNCASYRAVVRERVCQTGRAYESRPVSIYLRSYLHNRELLRMFLVDCYFDKNKGARQLCESNSIKFILLYRLQLTN